MTFACLDRPIHKHYIGRYKEPTGWSELNKMKCNYCDDERNLYFSTYRIACPHCVGYIAPNGIVMLAAEHRNIYTPNVPSRKICCGAHYEDRCEPDCTKKVQ